MVATRNRERERADLDPLWGNPAFLGLLALNAVGWACVLWLFFT
jgi:hypothetical protein